MPVQDQRPPRHLSRLMRRDDVRRGRGVFRDRRKAGMVADRLGVGRDLFDQIAARSEGRSHEGLCLVFGIAAGWQGDQVLRQGDLRLEPRVNGGQNAGMQVCHGVAPMDSFRARS
jgi:hypothetical protein